MTTSQTSETGPHDTESWGVVMTANEPSALVLSNVRWHLATGATAVHVYLDDPQDPVARGLEAISGCHVTRCDDACWAAHRGQKGRPASQMRRQAINANAARDAARTDWLFHIDADEFIWQDGDFGRELATHRDQRTELNLPVLERIFPDAPQRELFGGAFRATSDLSETDAAFGEFAPFMKRGQYSHGAGARCAGGASCAVRADGGPAGAARPVRSAEAHSVRSRRAHRRGHSRSVASGLRCRPDVAQSVDGRQSCTGLTRPRACSMVFHGHHSVSRTWSRPIVVSLRSLGRDWGMGSYRNEKGRTRLRPAGISEGVRIRSGCRRCPCRPRPDL